MRLLKNFLLLTTILVLLSCLFPLPSGAASYSELYSFKSKEKQTQSQIAINNVRLSQLDKTLLSLKQSLDLLNATIGQDQSQISTEKAHLSQLSAREAQDENKRQQLVQQFGAILTNIYENGGSLGYLSALLNATSWSDFICRLHELKIILNYNTSIQRQIVHENNLIIREKVSINQNINAIQSKVTQYNQLVAVQNQTLSREQSVYDTVSSGQRVLLQEKFQQLNQISDVEMELAAQAEEAKMAAQYGPVQGSGSTPAITQPIHVGTGKISALINCAESFLGTPYVWGGTTPHPGFDCSGFTQYTFAQIGVSLERTSEEQYLEGSAVSEQQLEPGDLVFFSTYAPGASHVGLYIGNGMMIDAEAYGVVFDNIYNSYWAPRYLGARRVVEP